MTYARVLLLCVASLVVSRWQLQAALAVRVPVIIVPANTNRVQVPITVSGGDLITDMVGFVQIGDGGPLVGGTLGPTISGVSYAGSIWGAASGGFTNTSSISLSNQVYDPNVSLNQTGQKVAANGLLMTLTVDVVGVAPGSYEIKIRNGVGPDMAFQNAGTFVPASLTNGLVMLGSGVRPIIQIQRGVNRQLSVIFQTQVGRSYRVQTTPDVVRGVWTDATADLPGTGSLITWTDVLPPPTPVIATNRYYRVRVLTQ